ncbi:MAG: acyltransferase family protein [Eubacterium sp.]
MVKDNTLKKQNNCLNFVKGCACFGVLYMHTSYDCFASSIIACLSRFAVLIFFMISGYYCYNEDRDIVNSKMPKKIRHILKLCLGATIIYFLWGAIFVPAFTGNRIDFVLFIETHCTLKNWINFFIFNQLSFGGTLWFLFALLYCYIILILVNKKNWYKGTYIAIPVLIILHIISRGIIQYFNLIDENINIIFYRNFIFMGFPFFMLGNFIHKYEERVVNIFSNKKLLGFIGVGLAISCIERLVVPLELFWGTVAATFCIFVFAVRNPEKKIVPVIADIGDKYSMPVYIFHPIVSGLIYYMKCAIGVENNVILAILNPIIVFVTIPLLVKLYEIIRERIYKLHNEA